MSTRYCESASRAFANSKRYALLESAGRFVCPSWRICATAGIPKAVEVYRGKLVIYGCGDFINDYEGISGHDEFRGDLGVMYFPSLDPGSGRLVDLELVAVCRRRLRLERASETDCAWLCGVLNEECERFGIGFDMGFRSRFAIRALGTPSRRAITFHGRT